MSNIKIDPSQIPDIEIRFIANWLRPAIEKYFSDLDHKREFEEWKKERSKA